MANKTRISQNTQSGENSGSLEQAVAAPVTFDRVTSTHLPIFSTMASKLAYPKMITRKFSLSALAAGTLLMTSNLAALGLGALEVKSNLDQPLDGTIELRVAPGDNIGSVKAVIASKEDFERLGIDYPSYLGDMSLSVENMGGDTYVLRVISNDVVIKEPFIHFLVRVDYAGGSFLREYTALIDPPVYAAEAPVSVAQPRAVGVDEAYQTEEEPQLAAENIDDYAEPVVESEVVDEVFTEQPTNDFQVSEPAQPTGTLPRDAQYGPVASGESLSVIAEELQRQFPDLSIYQIMQVLFEENRESFVNENINGLMKGAVLNIGDLNAIRQVDVAAAKQFFYTQLSEWDPSVLLSNDSDDGLRVGQDEYTFDDSIASNDSSEFASDDSYSSVNEAFQVGASTESDALVSSGDGGSTRGEVLALQQQISQLETSLASSNLENQELTERISLLEGQLADMNRLISLDVESADLAAVESTLAEQNANSDLLDESSDSATADDFLVDGDSSVEANIDGLEDTAGEFAATGDDGFIDPLAGLDGFDAEESNSDLSASDSVDGSELLSDGSEVSLVGDDGLDAESASDEVSTPASATASTSSTSSSSGTKAGFMDGIKSAVVDSGLWKIIGGAGALLLAGLGLWFARRRKADEEFEISMMSIESQSQSESEERAVSVPVDEDKSKTTDRETSFLTVYSDSDAVVQADEVDPVAEADVYIAYGRDEQAEEVLLDGIASKPARVDIKQKLLLLYHKNNNVEGFERIAEELYSQKNFLTKNVWQEVSLMGKDLAPENPLFDVSASDLLTDGGEADNMITSGDVVDADSTTISDDSVSETVEADHGEVAADVAVSDSENAEVKSAEEDPSINLINFDDDVSELDQVALGELEGEIEKGADELVDTVGDDGLVQYAEEAESQKDDGDEDDSVFEIDFSDDVGDSIIVDESDKPDENISEEFTEALSPEANSEVSDLEMDDDYDEARTQYELAKVFVDLGDEDGARKILDDIVANDENSPEVLEDAGKLLESINAKV